ncbi:MAG: Arginine-tRNA ligase [Candidatus Moranbacteria bacterium GW2011_GWF2_34_56]|nr:MAG: Arginine-tRNA ligase [Candidatus Moranbacteria bacterium GW2011_GWF2_34_56]
MKEIIKNKITEAVNEMISKNENYSDFELGDLNFEISFTKDEKFIAMILAGRLRMNPFELAQEIAQLFRTENNIEKVEAVAPGYINFYLSKEYFSNVVGEILKKCDDWGKIDDLKGKVFLAEHTDPNLFKEFHIGHVMTNTIGESLGRIAQFANAEVKQVTFQGDVGLHVAKTLWGMKELNAELPDEESDVWAKQAFLGKCYAWGEKNYSQEDNSNVKNEIIAINKAVYSKEDEVQNKIYKTGKEWSLKYFEEIYKILGSNFDHYFLESETFEDGKRIVEENLNKVFKESNGAIIFPGSEYGLHDRVFINSEGLPTYEAKDIGLFYNKWKKYNPDISLTITGGEQKEYFQVVKKAAGMINKEWEEKTIHIAHGTLRLKSGKMSSRKGEIVRAKKWIEDTADIILKKMKENNVSDNKEADAKKIAIAAIKYSILKIMAGKDIVYDEEKSISFEGDSGPYLQYSYVRANSILNKLSGYVIGDFKKINLRSGDVPRIEKMLVKFPEIVSKSLSEYSPHVVANYLHDLSAEFNSFYANTKIADEKNVDYKNNVALTEAFRMTLKNGLYLLGIEAVEKM